MNIYGDSRVARWLTPEQQAPPTLAGVRSLLALWARETTDEDCTGHWAVVERVSDTVVGSVSLRYLPPESDTLVIGWALAPRFWGYGYAIEAGHALTWWAIDEGGAIEVFAIVQHDNTRSKRTAEAIGMEWVADVGGHSPHGGYQLFRLRHGDYET
jgi:RimJ/RimL family protein N-acetyltransferase